MSKIDYLFIYHIGRKARQIPIVYIGIKCKGHLHETLRNKSYVRSSVLDAEGKTEDLGNLRKQA